MPKIAVLGATGRWGANVIKTLAMLPGVQIIASIGSGGAADPEGLLWRNAIDDAIGKGLNGVVIATPPSVHALQAVFCLDRGLPICIEKPLSLSIESASWIAKAAEKAQVPVLVDHTQLFHPGYTALKALLTNEKITRIDSIGGNAGPIRSDCSALWDYGPHDVALALDLLGQPIEPVRCSTVVPWPNAPIGAKNFYIQMLHAGEKQSHLFLGNGMAKKRRQLQVRTESGNLYILDDLDSKPLRMNKKPSPLVDWTPPLTVAMQVFVGALNGVTDSRLGLDLGLRVVEVLETCSIG